MILHISEPTAAARMVDVSDKTVTHRMARASAVVTMQAETLTRIKTASAAKGDVLGVARLAGITAAKKTGDLIPLCHPLGLDGVEMSFEFVDDRRIRIVSEVRVEAKTGVEMEAMVAVSTAALTIYDMCKSMDREMVIEQIQLEKKVGGKSGTFRRT